MSILAAQAGTGRLRPWQDDEGRRGHTIYMLAAGHVSAQEMLRRKRAASDRLKWLLRGGGTALMWLGMGLSLSWIPALASRLPLLGGLVGSLAGAGVGLVSLAGALSASSAVVAIAWARFRPLHSAALLASAVAAYYSLCKAALAINQAQPLGAPAGARSIMAA